MTQDWIINEFGQIRIRELYFVTSTNAKTAIHPSCLANLDFPFPGYAIMLGLIISAAPGIYAMEIYRVETSDGLKHVLLGLCVQSQSIKSR
jgi:hypothetical protein